MKVYDLTTCSLADVPATIHHLRPRGRDIIHVTVGGHIDGELWVPSQEDMLAVRQGWEQLLASKITVVVTPPMASAQVKPEGSVPAWIP